MYHLKWITRQLARQKGYFTINIVGLAIAFSVSSLIYTYLMKEWQMDAFHEQNKHIYRITTQRTGIPHWNSEVCSQLGEFAKAEIPVVKDYTRIIPARKAKIKLENDSQYHTGINCAFADISFFNIFSFPWVSGNIPPSPQNRWAVISEQVARYYFNGEDPVGKLMYTENLFGSNPDIPFHVIGVMKDIPSRSSIQADIILDFSVIEPLFRYNVGNAMRTFLLLSEHPNLSETEKQLLQIEYREMEDLKAEGETIRLQPLAEMYLHSDHIQDYDIPFLQGSDTFNLILSGISLLILLLAFSNYLIISLAQIHKQTTRLAIQKYFGISDKNIFSFLSLEIGIHLTGAIALSMILVAVSYPYFVQIISPKNQFPFYLSVTEVITFVSLILLFAGITTVILYTRITRKINRTGIKLSLTSSRSAFDLKKILMISQISIFCTLLFFAIVLIEQMTFVQNKSLGYNNQNTLTWDCPDPHDIPMLKEELSHHPDILAVSNGEPFPIGNWIRRNITQPGKPDKTTLAYSLICDEDLLKTYQIELIEGRNAQTKITKPGIYSLKPVGVAEIVVNQKFVQQMGLTHPIGTVLQYDYGKLEIVGVVKDFHYRSLHEPIQPVMLGSDLAGLSLSLVIRYEANKRNEVLRNLHELHDVSHPEETLHYHEYSYSELYEKEHSLMQLIYIFTGIALLIGSMGVIAFSVFTTGSKTKEIALRKVNGATEGQISVYLNRIFIRQVAIACLIGIPLAYYVCRQWLQGFAYQISISAGIFVLVIFITLLLVVLVTSWQIHQAARENPIDTLKSE